jgi:hypothetical protein
MVISAGVARLEYEPWVRLIRSGCLAVEGGELRSTMIVLPLSAQRTDRHELMRLATRVVEEYNLVAEVKDSARSIAVQISRPREGGRAGVADRGSMYPEPGPFGERSGSFRPLCPPGGRRDSGAAEEPNGSPREPIRALWRRLAFGKREE